MTVKFSTAILDTHIAPGVSAFTSAEIPDMTSWSKESSHWIANFFLNSAFSGSFAPPMNAYAYNFIRRAQYAFSEHELARGSTLTFVAGGCQSSRANLTYAETAELLKELAKYADALSNPSTAKEVLSASEGTT